MIPTSELKDKQIGSNKKSEVITKGANYKKPTYQLRTLEGNSCSYSSANSQTFSINEVWQYDSAINKLTYFNNAFLGFGAISHFEHKLHNGHLIQAAMKSVSEGNKKRATIRVVRYSSGGNRSVTDYVNLGTYSDYELFINENGEVVGTYTDYRVHGNATGSFSIYEKYLNGGGINESVYDWGKVSNGYSFIRKELKGYPMRFREKVVSYYNLPFGDSIASVVQPAPILGTYGDNVNRFPANAEDQITRGKDCLAIQCENRKTILFSIGRNNDVKGYVVTFPEESATYTVLACDENNNAYILAKVGAYHYLRKYSPDGSLSWQTQTSGSFGVDPAFYFSGDQSFLLLQTSYLNYISYAVLNTSTGEIYKINVIDREMNFERLSFLNGGFLSMGYTSGIVKKLDFWSYVFTGIEATSENGDKTYNDDFLGAKDGAQKIIFPFYSNNGSHALNFEEDPIYTGFTTIEKTVNPGDDGVYRFRYRRRVPEDGTIYEIRTPEDLVNMSDKYGRYVLMNDLDMNGVKYETPFSYTEHGDVFAGSFDGNNFKIKNLKPTVSDIEGNDGFSLFSSFIGLNFSGVIKNLELINTIMDGSGSTTRPVISGFFSSKVINSYDNISKPVKHTEPFFYNCKVTSGRMDNISAAGGVVGGLEISSGDRTFIKNVKVQNVTFENITSDVGGVAASAAITSNQTEAGVTIPGSIKIERCKANFEHVQGGTPLTRFVGGFFGNITTQDKTTLEIKESDSHFSTNGDWLQGVGFISSAYLLGTDLILIDVASNIDTLKGGVIQIAAGLIATGDIPKRITATRFYASLKGVTTRYARGNIFGNANATITFKGSHFNRSANDYKTVAGINPLTEEQMKKRNSFVGWDFADVWGISEGLGYPFIGKSGTFALCERIPVSSFFKIKKGV